MKKTLFVAAVLALALAGCSALEWADVARDAQTYTGAPGADPISIVTEVGKDVAASGGNIVEIAGYIVGGLVTVVGGWYGRKFVKKAYSSK
jgi:hypothetical protein